MGAAWKVPPRRPRAVAAAASAMRRAQEPVFGEDRPNGTARDLTAGMRCGSSSAACGINAGISRRRRLTQRSLRPKAKPHPVTPRRPGFLVPSPRARAAPPPPLPAPRAAGMSRLCAPCAAAGTLSQSCRWARCAACCAPPHPRAPAGYRRALDRSVTLVRDLSVTGHDLSVTGLSVAVTV